MRRLADLYATLADPSQGRQQQRRRCCTSTITAPGADPHQQQTQNEA